MKIDFLKDGSPDCPLIRIYGDERGTVSRLIHVFRELSSGAVQRAELHKLSGIEPVGGCTVTLVAHGRDEGVRQLGYGADFEWRLTPSSWEVVADLTEPFKEFVTCWSGRKPATNLTEDLGFLRLVISSRPNWLDSSRTFLLVNLHRSTPACWMSFFGSCWRERRGRGLVWCWSGVVSRLTS